MAESELVRRLAALDHLADDEIVDSGTPVPRAVAVEATGRYRLRVRFDDGRVADADLEGLAHRSKHFAALRDPAVVAGAEIAHDGAALRFGGDADLEIGSDLALALAERQRPMSGTDFTAWMRRHQLSENAAAGVLGLARRTVQGYKVVPEVPAVVAVACRAVDADRALLPALFRPRRPGRRRAGASRPAA